MGSSCGTVTQILRAAGAGNSGVMAELLPLVYEELRRLAGRQMAAEPAGQTLQPTALVHEAYLRLVGREDLRWEDRAHFFAAAARAMRQILVDRARQRRSLKRGGNRARIPLEHIQPASDELPSEQMLALDEALQRLEEFDERKARIVMLRYFAGLSVEDTAKALDLSSRSVKREWQFARAWLFGEMTRYDADQA